jgi:hypothetical protein
MISPVIQSAAKDFAVVREQALPVCGRDTARSFAALRTTS